MTKAESSAVAQSRMRHRRQEYVRVELQVRKEDVDLVRDVARALVDPERESETRTVLREQIVASNLGDLKALLAAAPLEGIELERAGEIGRDTDV